MTFEELEKEVQEIKARAAADLAFLRCAIFTLSTAQLRGTRIAMEKVAEDLSVKLLYMANTTEPGNDAYEARKKFWLDALQVEVEARDAVGRG